MKNAVAVLGDGESPRRDLARAVRIQSKTELAVFKQACRTRLEAETMRLETQALREVVKTAIEEELDLMDFGLSRAAGSPAKAEIVARKLTLFSNINSDRIVRRFGR